MSHKISAVQISNKRDMVILRPFLRSLWSHCVHREYIKVTEYVFEPFNYPFQRAC